MEVVGVHSLLFVQSGVYVPSKWAGKMCCEHVLSVNYKIKNMLMDESIFVRQRQNIHQH